MNPFPGAVPYRRTDRERFFGRDDLHTTLKTHIFVDRCTVVFGPSGAGKSSLLQARVLPDLVDRHAFRLVHVETWPKEQTPLGWWVRSIHEQLDLGPAPDGAVGLGDLDAAIELAELRSERPVLMFLDQLEQLLFPGRDPAQADELFAGFEHILRRSDSIIQLALSLREDYLGRFRGRAQSHRELLAHGFRVGPLTVGEMTKAVLAAAASGMPPQRWDAAEVQSLMEAVRMPGELSTAEAEVQATYGQIVCRALWKERNEGATVGAIEAEAILKRYFEGTLDELGSRREEAVRLLEDQLIDETGFRTLITENEARALSPDGGAVKLLETLETAAIVRATEHQTSRYFELGHDWLARWLFDRRRKRLSEAQALRDRQRAAEEAEKRLLEEEQRRMTEAFIYDRQRAELRSKLYLAIALFGLSVCVVFVLLYFLRGAKDQEARRKRADDFLALLQSSKRADNATYFLGEALKVADADRREDVGKWAILAYEDFWAQQAAPYDAASREEVTNGNVERAIILKVAAGVKRGRVAPDLPTTKWIRHVEETARLSGTAPQVRVASGGIVVFASQQTVSAWDATKTSVLNIPLVPGLAPLAITVHAGALAVAGNNAVEIFPEPLGPESKGLVVNFKSLEVRAVALGAADARSVRIAVGAEDGTVLLGNGYGSRVPWEHFQETTSRRNASQRGLFGSSITALALLGGNSVVTTSSFLWARERRSGRLASPLDVPLKVAENALTASADVRVASGQPRAVVSGYVGNPSVGVAAVYALDRELRLGAPFALLSLAAERAQLVVSSDLDDASDRVVSAVRQPSGNGYVCIWRATGIDVAACETRIETGAAPIDVAWIDGQRFAAAFDDETVRILSVDPVPDPTGSPFKVWQQWQVKLGYTVVDGTAEAVRGPPFVPPKALEAPVDSVRSRAGGPP